MLARQKRDRALNLNLMALCGLRNHIEVVPTSPLPAPPTARPQTLKLGPLLFASQIVFISFPHHNASVTDNLVVSAMNGYESVAAPSFKLAKQRFFRLPSSGIGLAC
jgi:hypothetical protein